jgi:oligopeptide transport system permease protein
VSLAAFVLRRILWAIPVLLLVMLVTFLLMRGACGSPFEPPEGVPGLPAPLQQELTDFYNLDEPGSSSLRRMSSNVVTLAFGPSLVNRDHSVDEAVEEGFPVTAELILLASAWAIPVGILLGLFAAVRRGSLLDHLTTSVASVLLVVPVLFVTYVLPRYFVLEWELFPVGWDSWQAKVCRSSPSASLPPDTSPA